MVWRNKKFSINNFKQIKVEQCLFKYTLHNKTKCIIGLYCDDMIISREIKYIKDKISKIKRKFKISNCGPIEYILGIRVEK